MRAAAGRGDAHASPAQVTGRNCGGHVPGGDRGHVTPRAAARQDGGLPAVAALRLF